MKVWVTKYALTKGIEEHVVEQTSSEGMVATLGGSFGSFRQYFHGEGRDWHRTLEGAKARAEIMRESKIKALKKSLAKFEKMKF